MPPTSRACWLSRLVLLGTWALLAAGAAHGADGDAASHLREAGLRFEPGASWEPPLAAPFGADAAGFAAVALPHVRERSIAEGDASLQAPPEVAWYRIDVPDAGDAGDLYLYLPRWQTIGGAAVYADGRLVHRTRGSRVWNSFNRPLWVLLTDPATGQPPRSVMVRLASQQGVGSAISTMWVGTQDALRWRWQLRNFIQIEVLNYTSGAFLVIGLFSLALWCVRRDEPMYALFFAAAVTHMMRSAHYVVGEQPAAVADEWFGWMTVNSLGWGLVWLFFFAHRVHRKRMPRLAAALVGGVVLCSVLTLPLPLLLPRLAAILPLAYLAVAALAVAVMVSGLWASHQARSREGLVLFIWFTLNFCMGVHDLFLQTYRIGIEGVYLMPYASIGLFAFFLAIVWRRYVGAIHGVETLNAMLETRLAEREAQLTASHEQLREMERQQTLVAERQRMMQDMHDGIGSSLMSALRMVERGQASSADTAQVLKDCIDDLKLAIDSLDAADADLLGLLATVRFRLAPRLKAAGIELSWSVQDLPPLAWLDPRSALHVLRIVQEVLTNILKHSAATRIDLATAHEGDEAVVRIRDNGTAFVDSGDAPRPNAGMGLSNVRNRALALGAACQWGAWPGGGEFCLRLPVRRAP